MPDRWHSKAGLKLDECMPLQKVKAFVTELHGSFEVVVRADAFWFNRLLLELHFTALDAMIGSSHARPTHAVLLYLSGTQISCVSGRLTR